MTQIALFAKVNDEWRFEGFTEHEEKVIEFVETVEEENGEGAAKYVFMDGDHSEELG